ncbi:MAG: CHASE2 domain-containing protein [Fodinibius sp.]|nr:CHASE2 domain-containing protein [Fodinibius sp.]
MEGRAPFPPIPTRRVIDDSSVVLASEDSSFQMNACSDPKFGLKHTDTFEDKIVLVGATMPELQDRHATPFARQGTMAGVEMHANAIQTVLSGKYIQYISAWVNMAILIGLITLVVVATRRFAGIRGFLIYLGLSLGVIGVVLYGFLEHRFIIGSDSECLPH